MKKYFAYFAAIAGIVSVGIVSGIKLESHRIRHKKKSLYEGFHQVARSDHPVTEQKSFVIVALSWNTSAYCEEHLLSIFNQSYDNYRIVYVDDASTDDTYEKVQEIVEREGQSERVTLIRNETNRGAMANWYSVVHSCDPNEIVVAVDGDDALAHTQVLEHLNRYYANPDVWMTFGQFVFTPSYKQGWCRPYSKKVVKKGGFRDHPFWASHLRTFYAGLFHPIPLEAFFYEGSFYPRACDVAIMTPLLELAGKHAYFVDEVMYRYRFDNPLCDHAVDHSEQLACEEAVRVQAPYKALFERPHAKVEGEVADLVIFSYNRPLQLYALLESIAQNVAGSGRTFVLYRSGDASYDEGYALVKNAFPHVVMVKQSNDRPKEDFKPLLMDILYTQSRANYVVFGVDDIITTGAIDFIEGTAALKKTGAYGLYYRLGENTTHCYMSNSHQGIPELAEVGNDLYAWQFSSGKADWDYPNSVDLTLFDKQEIRKDLETLSFDNPSWLEGRWAQEADHQKIGLVHGHSKMVNIPVNLVSVEFQNRSMDSYSVSDLNKKFIEGLKIDITPLQGIDNRSAHIDYELMFTER